MSEVTDLVMPVLQRIQSDLGEFKRKADKLENLIEAMSDRFDKIESYVTIKALLKMNEDCVWTAKR